MFFSTKAHIILLIFVDHFMDFKTSIQQDGSLLTHEESNAIKGLLILLVVLGHNAVLMKYTDLFEYIYSFHVYCFFILPYLYGAKQTEKTFLQRIRHILPRCTRYYGIFLFMVIFCLFISLLLHKVAFSFSGVFRAFITGSQILLINHIGFGMLWFLPAICSVSFWHEIYFSVGMKARFLLVILTSMLWILAALGITNYHELGLYVPFAIMPGLYHLLTGILGRKLIEFCKLNNSNTIKFIEIITGIVFIWEYVKYRSFLPCGCYYLAWLLCPVVATMIIYQLRIWLVKGKLLQTIGKCSFGIYLIHIFIFNLMLRFFPWNNLAWGGCLFFLTLSISFLVTLGLKKIPVFGRRI